MNLQLYKLKWMHMHRVFWTIFTTHTASSSLLQTKCYTMYGLSLLWIILHFTEFIYLELSACMTSVYSMSLWGLHTILPYLVLMTNVNGTASLLIFCCLLPCLTTLCPAYVFFPLLFTDNWNIPYIIVIIGNVCYFILWCHILCRHCLYGLVVCILCISISIVSLCLLLGLRMSFRVFWSLMIWFLNSCDWCCLHMPAVPDHQLSSHGHSYFVMISHCATGCLCQLLFHESLVHHLLTK